MTSIWFCPVFTWIRW